ncbi:hypothetical protein BRC89_12950 [Halobacteriales archaeon QS_4_70_19]|nr:MAG: hypothetical protein BRC89_12950 [Halobacteriales archaeon QS_4_70_19]
MRDDEPGSVRDAIDQSQHGAPAAGAVLRDRFETHEVFQRIVAGVVWLVYAVTDSLARIVVHLTFLAIPAADLFRVVSFTEVLYLVFLGEASPVGISYGRSYVPERPEEEGKPGCPA